MMIALLVLALVTASALYVLRARRLEAAREAEVRRHGDAVFAAQLAKRMLPKSRVRPKADARVQRRRYAR